MKRLVYLISPSKIYKKFYFDLIKVLSSKKVKFFQLRLKKLSDKKILTIAKKIKKITKKYNVKLIINDNPGIARKINADGCHIGQSDGSIFKTQEISLHASHSERLEKIPRLENVNIYSQQGQNFPLPPGKGPSSASPAG